VIAQIALDTPGLPLLDYLLPEGVIAHPGDWVVVPLGRRRVVGLVASVGTSADRSGGRGFELKAVERVCEDLPRVGQSTLDLYTFAAAYYQRTLGQVAATALPGWLKTPKVHEHGRSRPSRLRQLLSGTSVSEASEDGQTPQESPTPSLAAKSLPPLNEEQVQALEACLRESRPLLLHGVTGSGKTRVYLELLAEILARDHFAQALVLVPEIGLTPAISARIQEAFPNESLEVIHSGLSERVRATAWLRAATGRARILVGTRTAVLCPMPNCKLIVVDEEHDHSYKQQDGLRYSARDLAVWLGHRLSCPVVLGSATPSLESRAQAERGRYARQRLTLRATGAPRARTRIVDLIRDRPQHGLSEEASREIERALTRGEQALVFVNRRGWSPVLCCDACGWRQQCPDCSVPMVLHKRRSNWRLICHHCARQLPPPHACPECSSTDLQTAGQGSQRIEEALIERFPHARLARLDRDAVASPAALKDTLDRIERREVDLIVGTQMVAKGHDFAGLRLVVVADADAQLANPDFRAPEWLFATLIQVSGRAGRHDKGSDAGPSGTVLIQTRTPSHAMFVALEDGREDTLESYWGALLREREEAGMPPFGFLAAIRVSHAQADRAERGASEIFSHLLALISAGNRPVRAYAPVPRVPERLAGRTRWQVLLESSQRPALQQLLGEMAAALTAFRALEVHVEVDPLSLT